MLEHRVLPLPQPDAERIPKSQAAPQQATSDLARFIVVLVIICGLVSLYVWQRSAIFAIDGETDAMLAEIDRMEQENVEIMIQVARGDSPGHVAVQAKQLDMAVGGPALEVPMPELVVITRESPAGSPRREHILEWVEGQLSSLPKLAGR